VKGSSRRAPQRKTSEAISAGGVIVRPGTRGLEIILVGRSKARTWGLPKGTPDGQESLSETAIREVREETGVLPHIVDSLGSIEYYFTARSTRIHKRVHYFLMEPAGGDLSLHDEEYDLVEWVPIDDAVDRLTYPNEASIARRARDRVLGPLADNVAAGEG